MRSFAHDGRPYHLGRIARIARIAFRSEALCFVALFYTIVREFWFQISSAITAVEQLFEDRRYSYLPLAVLVAFKGYYSLAHLRMVR